MRIHIKDVEEAVRYLKQAFWSYGTNEAKYNYTREQFKAVWILSGLSLELSVDLFQSVLDDLRALKRYVLDAYSETGYDTTDDFEFAFTFEKTVLFTITIMTTVSVFSDVCVKTANGLIKYGCWQELQILYWIRDHYRLATATYLLALRRENSSVSCTRSLEFHFCLSSCPRCDETFKLKCWEFQW